MISVWKKEFELTREDIVYGIGLVSIGEIYNLSGIVVFDGFCIRKQVQKNCENIRRLSLLIYIWTHKIL